MAAQHKWDTLKWLSPWYLVTDDHVRKGLVEQLQKEMPFGHVLTGEPLHLIARRNDTDDALFALSGERVAEVHMTWRRGRETDPRFPVTSVFPTLEDWITESMIPTHQSFLDE